MSTPKPDDTGHTALLIALASLLIIIGYVIDAGMGQVS